MGITHTFVSAIADDPTAAAAGEVLPSHWNADHDISLTSSDVGLGNVTNDVQTKAAILPNTGMDPGKVPIGNASGTAYAPRAISGDGGLASDGTLTVIKTNGASFAASATTDTTDASNISAGTLDSARLDAQLQSLAGLSYTGNTLKVVRVNAGETAFELATPSVASGDVVGPASSTDNAIARFDSTTGKLLQNSSGATLSDNHALTLAGATVTADEPMVNVTQTWNNAGVTFTGWKLNITSTASAAASLLLDLQKGGSSRLSMSKDGKATVQFDTGVLTYGMDIKGTDGITYAKLGGANALAARNDLVVINADSSTGLVNVGAGVVHLTNASGNRALLKSYVNLELSPGALGGGGTYVEVNSGTASTYRDLKLRNLLASGGNGSYTQTPSMTVANLAVAATAGNGARAYVTDATLAFAGNVGTAVTGGGANHTPVVVVNGAWVIG